MIKIILENTGSILILDKHNADFLKKSIWENSHGYAVIDNDILLHRKIMNHPKRKFVVDHINGNKLDNRECNLRITSSSINGYNSISKKRINYGASKRKSGNFVAQVANGGKNIYLGTFSDVTIAKSISIEINNFLMNGGTVKQKRFNIIRKKYESFKVKKQKLQFCKKGHDLNIKENVIINKYNYRNCRICNKEYCNNYYYNKINKKHKMEMNNGK